MNTRRTIGLLAAMGAMCATSACASSSLGSATGNSTTVRPATTVEATSSAVSSPSSTAPSSTRPAGSGTASTTSVASPPSGLASSGASSTSNATASDVMAALRDGDVSAFVTALQASGLLEEVTGRSVTILAPDNDAFAALGAERMKDLLADPMKARQVLGNHIVAGALPADALAAKTSLTALSGRTLPVSTSGGTLTVDGATVVRADRSDRPVVVHVIDRVLGATS